MNFPGKSLSGFRYPNYLPSCKKSEKTDDQFLKKIAKLTDGHTYRQMHRQADGQTNHQTDNSDFIEPSVGWGSNKIVFSLDYISLDTRCSLYSKGWFFVVFIILKGSYNW